MSEAAPPAEPSPASTPVEAPQPRRSGLRWVVVAVAAVLVVAVLGGAVWFAAQSPIGAPSYLPADAVSYAELRLDLPGSQRERAADFLAHFPGFADRSNLDAKLDDTFDRLLREATDQRYSYTGEVKPWFNGQVALAVSGAVEGDRPDQSDEASPRLDSLLVVGVKDRAAARSVVDRLVADAQGEGVTITSSEYRGATLWTEKPSQDAEPQPSELLSPFADLPLPFPDLDHARSVTPTIALTDDAIVVAADEAVIRGALDRRAGAAPRLSDSTAFRDAMAGLRTDRAGAFFVSGEQLRTLFERAAPASTASPSVAEDLPERIVGTLHLESDRLVAEVRAELPESAPRPTPRESELTSRVPGDVLAYVEVPALGEGIGRAIEQLKAQPGFEDEAGATLEQVEAILGVPLEDELDWAGDTAVVGWMATDKPIVGLVSTILDPESARARLNQIVALLRLGALTSAAPLELDEEDYADTTITTLTVKPEAASLVGQSEGFALSWALTDEVFVLSVDDAFVKRILDGPSDGSLAESARFQDALEMVGGPATAGLSYFDARRIRAAATQVLSRPDRDAFERDVEPYLEPFDVVVGARVADGDELVTRIVLTVSDEESQQ